MRWLTSIAAASSLVLLVLLLWVAGMLIQQRILSHPNSVALAAPVEAVPPSRTPRPSPTAPANAVLWFPASPTPHPSATPSPSPLASATASPGPAVSAGPSPTLAPTIVPIVSSARFAPGSGPFMHNILVALDANGGALRRVTIAPGATFSFVKALGPRPTRLPWRNVFVINASAGAPVGETVLYRTLLLSETETLPPPPTAEPPTAAPAEPPTAAPEPPTAAPEPPTAVSEPPTAAPEAPTAAPEAPAVMTTLPTQVPAQPGIVPDLPTAMPEQATTPPAPPDATPAPAEPTASAAPTETATPAPEPVLGGGICDLASRYVVAARPLLPPAAFRFKRHSGGVKGVRTSDAVSIWFEDRGASNDLLITNLTEYWLLFDVQVNRGQVTVTAILQSTP